ncbi:FliI/YscN family ATPase [Aestuariivita sp.]|uniref:FliI/YscN family ATPase n=1 Tax=Aestuariivita sp. TaxID=1872407 RepID=UPI00216B9320|nr:FliI/YscN family ATPase [Aestuariivita sp.]MCE8007152.1 FliI/YscN family ATPase [Aestuariivita sp.]
MNNAIEALTTQIAEVPRWRAQGRVSGVQAGTIHVRGLRDAARIGDQVCLCRSDGERITGEIIQINQEIAVMMPHGSAEQVSLDDRVLVEPSQGDLAPSDSWIGRVVDPFGMPLDGQPLMRGHVARSVNSSAPAAHTRAALGARLSTGMAALNTFLPIVEGQRLGLFAGSGVGKSNMLAALCRNMEADVVVVAMIGERGRELRQFIDETLGPDGMSRAVIVAATSDQSALMRRRCAWSAMTVAEHFREQGNRVLLLADSVTRFAEAHREIALAAGEFPALRGYPASIGQLIMSLCERAGPGLEGEGSITALFSVLVAGSDFEEPIADILRGVLDGHVILEREIAERGRYPAINLSKSVSRSLPKAATEEENALLLEARRLLGAYEGAEMMLKAGLYSEGSDPLVDRAVRVWEELDQFIAKGSEEGIRASFDRLTLILRRAGPR